MNGEWLNHAAQWSAIVIGGFGVWATLRRMRLNEFAHMQARIETALLESRAECGKLHERINAVRDDLSEIGGRVARIEGRLNDRAGP